MTRAELLEWLRGADDAALFAAADKIRRERYGTEVFLRGIVEFSNHCVKRCRYCGLRAPNTRAQRYRLAPADILEAAALAARLGLGTVVLQSGDDPFYDRETIAALVRRIKREHDLAVTLSLGDRTDEEFACWKEAGADRYLLKIETGDKTLYERNRPGERIEDRLERVRCLKKYGYEVGSGVIVDLPGMDLEILAADIETLAGLELDMLAAGPFIPHPDTPLRSAPQGLLAPALRTSALLRILNPWANIASTSALDAAAPNGRKLGLNAGCNVLMPSLTPEKVRADYAIYPGKNAAGIQDNVRKLQQDIRELGLEPSNSQGFARRSSYVRKSPPGRQAGDYAGRTP